MEQSKKERKGKDIINDLVRLTVEEVPTATGKTLDTFSDRPEWLEKRAFYIWNYFGIFLSCHGIINLTCFAVDFIDRRSLAGVNILFFFSFSSSFISLMALSWFS